MAAVPRPSAPTTWLSIKTACMIVEVRAPGANSCSTATAHNRPKAVCLFAPRNDTHTFASEVRVSQLFKTDALMRFR